MTSVIRRACGVGRGAWGVFRFRIGAASVLALAATFGYPSLAARQMQSAPVYAIQGAKIVTGTTTIDKGNLVMRNGVIEDVGANAAIPADAVVVDGAEHDGVSRPDRHDEHIGGRDAARALPRRRAETPQKRRRRAADAAAATPAPPRRGPMPIARSVKRC